MSEIGEPGPASGATRPWEPCGSLPPVTITDVKAICTAPDGIRLVVVKIETSDAGLWGVGCATFTQRPLAVVTAIEQYLRPFLVGRNPDDIEDIWQASFVSSYWRGGPVLNNAMSGVDEALWDIKGKRAGMPVYELLGGRVRRAADVYVHANGRDVDELEDRIREFGEQGFRHVRCQVEVPGYATYGRGSAEPEGAGPSTVGAPGHAPGPVGARRRTAVSCRGCSRPSGSAWATMSSCSTTFTSGCHRSWPSSSPRTSSRTGCSSSRTCSRRRTRSTTACSGPRRARPWRWASCTSARASTSRMIKDRLIDFIRVHISDIGGITPARKLAAFAELFGVRTAWHGPGDVSPVGHAANLHLDVALEQLRDPGGLPLPGADPGGLPGLPRDPRLARCGPTIARASASTSTSSWPRGTPFPSTPTTEPGRRSDARTGR